jgi:alcohol dehydrogenase (NADP+)
MKAGVEHAFVAGQLIARTGRHLVVLTLPLLCWLAGQECPAQALLAWVVQRSMALLATPQTAARAGENFDVSRIPADALEEINRSQTSQRLNDLVRISIPGFVPEGA